MNWTLQDVVNATGATAAAAVPDDLIFSSISTDSRQVEAGALFFALRGPRHDGHNFVAEALRLGAAGAVVDHPIAGVSAALGVCARYAEGPW